ncbi:MAG: hypothetical protein NTW21_11130 [Verrucomicrobia bacterium]|nr:hypothetical protein [Verrucomicrobiota bacterium]
MKNQSNPIHRRAATALLLLGLATAAGAFNQDHYFLYKSVAQAGAGPIGVGPTDKLYVADGSGVSIYDPDLNLLSRIDSVNATGVTVAADGTVYVADQTAGIVRKYNSAGDSLGNLCSCPCYEVEMNPVDGTIYVRSGASHSIYRTDGTLAQSFTAADARFDVGRDGKVYQVTGNVYNTTGILERNTGILNFLAIWKDLKIRGGVAYCTWHQVDPWNNKTGGLVSYDADWQPAAISFSFGGSLPHPGRDSKGYCLNVNHKGDFILSRNGTVFLERRCEAESMGPETRNAAPTAEITAIQQRPNSTLLDIDYQVTDLDDATVQVAAAAFKSNTNDLTNMILLNTLVEGTAANVGAAITTGVPHHLTWDVRSDWGVDFGDVSVHIFARDSRPLLMGLHFLSLPANGTNPAITITRSPIEQYAFMEPLMWLAASKNSAVSFATAQIKGVGGAFDNQLLASGTTVTQAGRQFVEALMNVREATSDEVQAAREASTLGNVNQWDLTDPASQKIDRTYPLKVNEYGFDTGSYDPAQWFWLVKVD